MPGKLSRHVASQVLAYLTKGEPITIGPAAYVGLSLRPHDEIVFEPTAHSYSGVVVDASYFGDPDGSVVSNVKPIVFPRPREDWGDIRSIFLGDANGFVIASCDTTSMKAINKGDKPPSITIGGLSLVVE